MNRFQMLLDRLKQVGATVLVAVVMTTVLVAQTSEPEPSKKTLALSRGASVYIAAFHRIHDTTGTHPTGSNAGYVIPNDLGYEGQIKEEFEKRHLFKVVNKLSDADFVFLLFVDGSAAEGFAISREQYSRYKDKSDLDALREGATWRGLVGPFKIPTRGKLASHLVKQFHETAKS